jgi:hypothetical protein
MLTLSAGNKAHKPKRKDVVAETGLLAWETDLCAIGGMPAESQAAAGLWWGAGWWWWWGAGSEEVWAHSPLHFIFLFFTFKVFSHKQSQLIPIATPWSCPVGLLGYSERLNDLPISHSTSASKTRVPQLPLMSCGDPGRSRVPCEFDFSFEN